MVEQSAITQGDSNNITDTSRKIVYFAVGPIAQEIVCPLCEVSGKTIIKWKWNLDKQHFCSNCGEYLGVFRRPQL